ncbi:MAG: PH domain-containing protein, partial [Propionibacteriaceae bacterium]|nr:PH domain-containing protein [Propionibacteriaceae bacterium]
LAFGWWIARTRTYVGEEGIDITTWRSRRMVPWDQVTGLHFPKSGFAQVVTTDDEYVRLSAVGFQDLPRLSEASNGRIRDPFAAGATSTRGEG